MIYKVSVLYKYVHSITVSSRQDTKWLSAFLQKHCIDEINQGFSRFWFYNQVLIHTISSLTFRIITKVSLPYQDAVIIIFKMALKSAAMISCAKRI